MSNRIESITAALAGSQFRLFVPYAFRRIHGHALGEQPYVTYMCEVIEELISGERKRLLINLPPQHLKSFVGTICLSAYLLGTNPRLRLLLVAYNDDFAAALCGRIRDMMQTPWYRQMFATRIKDGHSRANDFHTSDGGGIFAVAATGAVTGRTADFLIYDDPHQIGDWNDERKIALVRDNFNVLRSRLHDKMNGPIVVIAHRVAWEDLSADLLQDNDWTHLALPLVAVRRKSYELGHDRWVRERGDVLRPQAYSQKEIDRLRRTQVAPPFALFYQQGLGSSNSDTPRREHFQTFSPHQRPIAPVVLSIDPSQGGGINASRSVIQAWSFFDKRFFLVDAFCEHCDLEQQRTMFWSFVKRYRPSVALIEKTASGPALYAAVRQKARFPIHLIVPRQSKATRLGHHLSKIRGRRIHLPEHALWQEAFIDEVVNFPAVYDDQVDAMTQYFDFMDTKPIIAKQPPRDSGFVVLHHTSRFGR